MFMSIVYRFTSVKHMEESVNIVLTASFHFTCEKVNKNVKIINNLTIILIMHTLHTSIDFKKEQIHAG